MILLITVTMSHITTMEVYVTMIIMTLILLQLKI